MNLAINARDSMPAGGKLTITTANTHFDAAELDEQTAGDYIELAVEDTGVGMSPELQAHVFEPFFTTKETGQGTGLGLATVYGIVKQSGGRISIDSEPGRGTTFQIRLPRADGAVEAARQEASQRVAATGDETVLVVEDDAAVRALAERILTRAGYTVLSAANGEQAVALCDAHPGPIALLLTDVVMPLLSGRALVERLHARRPGLRVLFMSGYPDAFGEQENPIAAETQLIRKPFTAVELTHRVRAILDVADA